MGDATNTVADMRGRRYCEILVSFAGSTQVRVGVYNTFGLNDCPQALWDEVDPAQVQSETAATAVILNGPRYWVPSSPDPVQEHVK